MNSLHTVSIPDTIGVMVTFGERLRELRKSKGISQERLAEMIDYQRTNLANIENGKKKASEEVLKKLAGIPELETPLETFRAWKRLDEVDPQERGAIIKELLGTLPVKDTMQILIDQYGVEEMASLVEEAMKRRAERKKK